MKKIYILEYSVDNVNRNIEYGTRYFASLEAAKAAMTEIAEDNFAPGVNIDEIRDGVFAIDDYFYYADFSIKEYEVEG
jgi:hypothetical protein